MTPYDLVGVVLFITIVFILGLLTGGTVTQSYCEEKVLEQR